MAILEHVGIPLSYRNIIWALLSDVRAQPCVHGATSEPVYTMMKDGLKQGCPLSPLLFILVIDPLVTALTTLPEVHPRCFADDMAVGTEDWRAIATALPFVDAWSEVSRCLPNGRKTKLLTTSPSPPHTPRHPRQLELGYLRGQLCLSGCPLWPVY